MTNRLINLVAFGILALLWILFGAALLFNRAWLDAVWQSFRSWPVFLQLILALITLPVAAGLWIWETSWPLLLRLLLVIGLAWVTIYTFLPRKTASQTEASHA